MARFWEFYEKTEKFNIEKCISSMYYLSLKSNTCSLACIYLVIKQARYTWNVFFLTLIFLQGVMQFFALGNGSIFCSFFVNNALIGSILRRSAIIELTKIPFASACYFSPSILSRVIFGFSLFLLSIITFLTFTPYINILFMGVLYIYMYFLFQDKTEQICIHLFFHYQ